MYLCIITNHNNSIGTLYVYYPLYPHTVITLLHIVYRSLCKTSSLNWVFYFFIISKIILFIISSVVSLWKHNRTGHVGFKSRRCTSCKWFRWHFFLILLTFSLEPKTKIIKMKIPQFFYAKRKNKYHRANDNGVSHRLNRTR